MDQLNSSNTFSPLSSYEVKTSQFTSWTLPSLRGPLLPLPPKFWGSSNSATAFTIPADPNGQLPITSLHNICSPRKLLSQMLPATPSTSTFPNLWSSHTAPVAATPFFDMRERVRPRESSRFQPPPPDRIFLGHSVPTPERTLTKPNSASRAQLSNPIYINLTI